MSFLLSAWTRVRSDPEEGGAEEGKREVHSELCSCSQGRGSVDGVD